MLGEGECGQMTWNGESLQMVGSGYWMLHVGMRQEGDGHIVRTGVTVRGEFELHGLRGDGTSSRSGGANSKDGEGRFEPPST